MTGNLLFVELRRVKSWFAKDSSECSVISCPVILSLLEVHETCFNLFFCSAVMTRVLILCVSNYCAHHRCRPRHQEPSLDGQ